MGKRIVIALGGNALGKTISEQAEVVKGTAKAVAGLVRAGHQVVISHGNGPQVGMIQKAMTALHKQDPEHYELCPLSVCTAMSQGYIGLDLQRALRNELEKCGILKSITTILTQVEVNPNDDAFKNPSKPIGAYVTEAEAEVLRKERGFEFAEDAGRGIRRVGSVSKAAADSGTGIDPENGRRRTDCDCLRRRRRSGSKRGRRIFWNRSHYR